MGAIALGLYLAIAADLSLWAQYRQAYELEQGVAPVWPNVEEWIILAQVAGKTFLPCAIAAVVGLCGLWIVKRICVRQIKGYSFWVACYQGRIIGRAVTIPQEQYTLLTILYIAPEHRGQRVGSHLLWHCLQEAKIPVYLVCYRHLQPFFRRLGFVSVPSLSLPDELKRSLPPEGMVMKLSLLPTVPAPIIYLPFAPSRKWSIHLLTSGREKRQVYRTLGKRQRFRRSRRQRWIQLGIMAITPFLCTIVVLSLLKYVPGLQGLRNFDIPIMGLYLSSFALAVLLLTLLLGSLWILLGWQEWVVMEGTRIIAYVQFCTYARCSVLHQLHIEPQYPQAQMTQLLLGYFSRKVQFPLFVACPRRDRPFYAKLGFAYVRRTALPFEMNVVRWGNARPLRLSYDTATQFYANANPEFPLNPNAPPP